MKEFICKFCSGKFGSEQSLEQHVNAKHIQGGQKEKKKINIKLILFIAIILVISLTIYFYNTRPGNYDNFAKCLTEKGVVMYGNTFCQYTNKQLNFFGKSKEYLNYVKCSENEALCNSKGVKITPTWEINGTMYEQVQSFEKLALLSGCALK